MCSTILVSPESSCLCRLNPIEPPWYGPVCPVVWEGWRREVPPYPDPCPIPASRDIRRERLSWGESRCGAVVLGRPCRLPPLSSGGALVGRPCLRFHTPLI